MICKHKTNQPNKRKNNMENEHKGENKERRFVVSEVGIFLVGLSILSIEEGSKIFTDETRPTGVIDFIGSAVEFLNKDKTSADEREWKIFTWQSKTPRNVTLRCKGCSISLEIKYLKFSGI